MRQEHCARCPNAVRGRHTICDECARAARLAHRAVQRRPIRQGELRRYPVPLRGVVAAMVTGAVVWR